MYGYPIQEQIRIASALIHKENPQTALDNQALGCYGFCLRDAIAIASEASAKSSAAAAEIVFWPPVMALVFRRLQPQYRCAISR